MSTVAVAVLLVAWVLGALWGGRWFAREVFFDKHPAEDWIEVVAGGVFGFGLGVTIWPLLVLCAVARRVTGADNPRDFAALAFGESREARLARREQEVYEREVRIDHLERSTGVQR